jgi:hypothetical protein
MRSGRSGRHFERSGSTVLVTRVVVRKSLVALVALLAAGCGVHRAGQDAGAEAGGGAGGGGGTGAAGLGAAGVGAAGTSADAGSEAPLLDAAGGTDGHDAATEAENGGSADAGADGGAPDRASDASDVDASDVAVPFVPRYLGSVSFLSRPSTAAAAFGPDGALYLGGTFTQSTDFDPGPGEVRRAPDGQADGFLTKLAPDGSHAWTLTFGGSFAQVSIFRIAVTVDAIFVAGDAFGPNVDLDPGPAMFLPPSAGISFHTGFVSRFSLNGKLVWASPFVGMEDVGAHALAVDGAGGVYVGGEYWGTCDFDPGPGEDLRTAPGGERGFLTKLAAADGRALWTRTFTTTGAVCLGGVEDVALSTTGDVWTTGVLGAGCSFGGLAGPQNAVAGALLASFSPAGDARTLAKLVGAQGHALVATSDGALVVGGEAVGTVDFDPGAATQSRDLPADAHHPTGFLLRLTVAGAFTRVDTFADLSVRSLAAVAGGDTLMLGVAPSGLSPPPGYLTARVDAANAARWSFRLGDPDVLVDAVAAGPTSLVVAGSTRDSHDLDPGPALDLVPAGTVFFSRFAL